MNDDRNVTTFNTGAWREFLRHKLAHEGALPLRFDQFGPLRRLRRARPLLVRRLNGGGRTKKG
jgi:hypothetical protein